MRKLLKTALILPAIALLASCGLGDKISDTELANELNTRRENFDESKLLGFESKGSSTSDIGNDIEVTNLECVYNKDATETDTIKTVKEIINWDLDDVRARVKSLTDEKLSWKFYKNSKKGALYATAFFGETLTIDGNEFENNFDFEYGWNEQGYLFHAHEYITTPNDETIFLEDTLTTNLEVTFTFAE